MASRDPSPLPDILLPDSSRHRDDLLSAQELLSAEELADYVEVPVKTI